MATKTKHSDLIETPDKCSGAQIEAFKELLVAGDQVQIVGLEERIHQAHWLAFHYANDKLVAIAAVKNPDSKYRDRIFRKANAPVPADRFASELGWAVTHEQFRRRGIGQKLLERLLDNAGRENIYATTRRDNRPMQNLLKRLDFAPVGNPFFGNRGHELQLWIR